MVTRRSSGPAFIAYSKRKRRPRRNRLLFAATPGPVWTCHLLSLYLAPEVYQRPYTPLAGRERAAVEYRSPQRALHVDDASGGRVERRPRGVLAIPFLAG